MAGRRRSLGFPAQSGHRRLGTRRYVGGPVSGLRRDPLHDVVRRHLGSNRLASYVLNSLAAIQLIAQRSQTSRSCRTCTRSAERVADRVPAMRYAREVWHPTVVVVGVADVALASGPVSSAHGG